MNLSANITTISNSFCPSCVASSSSLRKSAGRRVKCAAMRRTRLLQRLSWRPPAGAVILAACLLASVGDASYEKTCTLEDRLRPRGICGQQLTLLISTLCQSQYNKRNVAAASAAAGNGAASVVTATTLLHINTECVEKSRHIVKRYNVLTCGMEQQYANCGTNV